MLFNFLYKRYREKFYDKLIEEFLGQIPDDVKEPALEFLADRRVLFEKFLSIQAFYIQRARIHSKKSTDFYDGALMIIRAFLAAVNRKVVQRTMVVQKEDPAKQVESELKNVSDFLTGALSKK